MEEACDFNKKPIILARCWRFWNEAGEFGKQLWIQEAGYSEEKIVISGNLGDIMRYKLAIIKQFQQELDISKKKNNIRVMHDKNSEDILVIFEEI